MLNTALMWTLVVGSALNLCGMANFISSHALLRVIGCTPRIFTKIIRILICYLRERGVNLAAYIDDIIIFADNFESCQVDTYCTIQPL